MTGLGGAEITAKQVTLTMKIGQFPKREYSVVIAPIKEYIIGIDIIKAMSLDLDDGRYQFAVWAFKILPITVGHLHMTPVKLPEPAKIVALKQY